MSTTVVNDLTLTLNLFRNWNTPSFSEIVELELFGNDIDVNDQTCYLTIDTGLQDQTLVISGFLGLSDQTWVINGLTATSEQSWFMYVLDKSSEPTYLVNTYQLPFVVSSVSACTHTGTHLYVASIVDSTPYIYKLEMSNYKSLFRTRMSAPVTGIATDDTYFYVQYLGENRIHRINIYTGVDVLLSDPGYYTLTGVTPWGANSALAYNQTLEAFFVIDGNNRLWKYVPETDTTTFIQQLSFSDFGGLEWDKDRFLLRTNNKQSNIIKLDEQGGTSLSVQLPSVVPYSRVTDIGYSGFYAYTLYTGTDTLYELDIVSVPETATVVPQLSPPRDYPELTQQLTTQVLDPTSSELVGYTTRCYTVFKYPLLSNYQQNLTNFTTNGTSLLVGPLSASPVLVPLLKSSSTLLLDSNQHYTIQLLESVELELIDLKLQAYNVIDVENFTPHKLFVEYSINQIDWIPLLEVTLDRDQLTYQNTIGNFLGSTDYSVPIINIRLRADSLNTHKLDILEFEFYRSLANEQITSINNITDSNALVRYQYQTGGLNRATNLLVNSGFQRGFESWSYSGTGSIQLVRQANLTPNDQWRADLTCELGETLILTSQPRKIESSLNYVFSAFARILIGGDVSIILEFLDLEYQIIGETSSLVATHQRARLSIPFVPPNGTRYFRVKMQVGSESFLEVNDLQVEPSFLTDWNDRFDSVEMIKTIVEF